MAKPITPVLLTPPAAYPVTVAEVRAQLGIDTDDFDARLAALIAAATEDVEAFLGAALITRSYQGFLDAWPKRREGTGGQGPWPGWPEASVGDAWRARHVAIPMPPLISIDYVKTYDDSDTPTTFDPSNYFVDAPGSRLVLRTTASWPVPSRAANGIEIGWTCGVGATLRPFQDERIRQALLITVGAYNEMRGDETGTPTLPDAARHLLMQRRVDWL